MSPKITMVCAASVVFAVGFSVGYFGWRRIQVADAATEEAEARVAQLSAELATWRKRSASAEEQAKSIATRMAADTHGARAVKAGGRAEALDPRRGAGVKESATINEAAPQDPESVLVGDPDYMQLRMAWYRGTLGLNFGPIYRSLGLSAEQIAGVERALATQYEENMEARAAAAAKGFALSDPALAALAKSIASNTSKSVREMLGPEKAREFFAEMKTATIRASAVDPLAGNLYYTDTPLTLSQAAQLTRIVAANTGEHKQDGLIYGPRMTNWDAVLNQAALVLTPAQLATFRSLRERDVAVKKMSDMSAQILRDVRAKQP